MSHAWSRVKRFLVAQDCWYLLSGFLMLVGCWLMSQAPGADSVDLGAGLRLQGVVLAYQLAVVGLAVYVRRRLRVESDGFNLACVALALLPDPTFFTIRFWGYSRAAGMAVNAVALVVSVLMLVFLAEAGRFPIRGRSMAAWCTLLVLAFGGGALFEPGDSVANARAMDLLCFSPLLLAAIAASFDAGAADEQPNARLAAHPVLWGNPANIYRRYLAGIVLAYPFFIMLRHLNGLGAVFAQDVDIPRMGPAILGLAVLLVRGVPGAVEHPGLLGALGGASILASSYRSAGAFPIFAWVLAANVAFGFWVNRLRGKSAFPIYGTLCAALLVGGRTPEAVLGAVGQLSPGPLAVLVIAAWVHAVLDGGFWEIYGASLSAVLLLFRASGLPGAVACGGFVHAAAILYLACVHAYPRKDLHPTCGLVAGLLLVSLMPGAHGLAWHAELFRAVLSAEAVGFLLAGMLTRVRSYAWVSCGVMSLELLQLAGRHASQLDYAALLWTWGGPAAVLLAFATLALGLAASREKSRA